MKAFLEKIHALWIADETLNGLLSEDLFFTGKRFRTDLPFAWIEITSDIPSHANKNHVLNIISAQIRVVHEDYVTGVAIRVAIIALYDRKAFDIDSGRAIAVQAMSVGERQMQGGEWHFRVDLNAIVQPD